MQLIYLTMQQFRLLYQLPLCSENSFTNQNLLKMKKLTICIMAACLSATFIPTTVSAAPTISTSVAAPATNTTDAAQADALIARLDEIKAMDKSSMSFSEKRNLHKEVRTIKEQLKDIGGGVYLSVGAVILIVILLIILL